MSLVIAEKKQQQRPGGCAGIFFQLWEWNRRLAKKKLFSRKLLPPPRTAKKATSKKFGTDEKMPVGKLLLIADENRGGFPTTKKPEADTDMDSGMRAPGLVARLMGLEAMPVVTHEKPRKAMDYSGSLCSKNQRNDSSIPRHDQDLCRETGGFGKAETRPPKLQKTGGFLERRVVDDEQIEEQSLFCKNMPPQHVRSKHQKLASPLKSPRLLSGSHKARLMQAATKILEPGMQSRNRPRYAITYMNSSVTNEVIDEGTEATAVPIKSKELPHDSVFGSSMDYGYMVRDSHIGTCKNEPMENEVGSSTLRSRDASSSCDHSARYSVRNIDMQNGQDMNNTSLPPSISRFSIQNKQSKTAERRRHHLRNEKHLCKPRSDETPISNLKGDNFRQNQPAAVRHTLAFGSKVYSGKQNGRDSNEIGRRIFMSSDRSMGSHACSRSGVVRDEQRLEVSRNVSEKNLSGKRAVSSCQIEQISATNSVPWKEINGNGFINQKERELMGNQSISRKYIKRELSNEGGDSFSGRDNGIVSTFNSPMRRPVRSFSCEKVMEKNKARCEFRHGPSKSDVNNCNMGSQGNAPLSGNELSNLIDKKIRELTSLDQNELGSRDVRATASILQELISAFTLESPVSDQSGRIDTLGSSTANYLRSYGQDPSKISSQSSQMFKRCKESQKDVKIDISVGNLHADNDQPSPISILEASFSNDSCSYRSLDVSSEGKPQIDWTESCSTTQSLDMETDLLDSATSVDTWKSNMERHQHSAEKFKSRIANQSCEGGLPVSKLQAVVKALPNVELLFQNFAMYRSDGKLELSLRSFLLDTLETILNTFPVQKNMGFKEAKEADTLKRCVFDCMIQCLDSKYCRFCKSGYKIWKLPRFLSQEQLRREVNEEVRGWMDLSGRLSDEIIEKEMNNSMAKWTYCEDEAFHTSKEIEGDILQALVNEMVIDFY